MYQSSQPLYSRPTISSPLLPTLSLKCPWRFLTVSPRSSNDVSANSVIVRPKNETGFESGVGEGDISGCGLRAAISACDVLE